MSGRTPPSESPDRKRVEFEAKLGKEALNLYEPVASIRDYWLAKFTIDSDAEEAKKKQELWKELANNAAKQAVKLIENGHPGAMTLEGICSILGEERQRIGKLLGHNPQYGKLRETGIGREIISSSTDLSKIGLHTFSQYASQFPFMKSSILHLLRVSSAELSIYRYTGKRRNGGEKYNAIDIVIFGKGIDESGNIVRLPYSRLVFVRAKDFYFHGPGESEHIVLMHMNEKYIRSAMRYVNTLYQTILNLKKADILDEYELTKNVGFLLWHMYNIMRYELGSSSVTQMLHSISMQLYYIMPKIIDFDNKSADFRAFGNLPEDFVFYFLNVYNSRWAERFNHELPEQKETAGTNVTDIIPPEEDNFCDEEFPSRQVDVVGQYHELPLCMHDFIPFAERCPNQWRRPYERFIINAYGHDNLSQKIARRIVNPVINWLEKYKTVPPDKLEFLKKPQALYSIWNNRALPLPLDPSTNYYTSYKPFIDFINEQSLSVLVSTYQNYLESQALFNLIDNLPYPVRVLITKVISKKSVGTGHLTEEDIARFKWMKENWLSETLTGFNSKLENSINKLIRLKLELAKLSKTPDEKSEAKINPAAIRLYEVAIINGDLNLLPNLINSKNEQQAFLLAILQGDLNILKWFVERRHLYTGLESTPDALMLAVYFERVELVSFLLVHNCVLLNDSLRYENLNIKKGATALWIAVKVGNENIVKLLLEKGADPSRACHDGETPLQFALKKKNYSIAKLLLDKCSDCESSCTAEEKIFPKNIQKLALKWRIAGESAKQKFSAMTLAEKKVSYEIAKKHVEPLTNKLYSLLSYYKLSEDLFYLQNVVKWVQEVYEIIPESKSETDAYAAVQTFRNNLASLTKPEFLKVKFSTGFFSSTSLAEIIKRALNETEIKPPSIRSEI